MIQQEMVTITKKEYEHLLEEIGIIRNPTMMDAILESDEAKRQGIKTWKIYP